MRIIDFHAHAFPDSLANKAITALSEHSGDYRPFLDGTIKALLTSMDENGITSAVIASIATKPAQALPILEWSKMIAGDRIIPFGSLHPKSPSWPEEIEEIKRAGLHGIKLHPLYQDFEVDDPALTPLFRACERLGLVVLCHAGYDIAFPGDERALPIRFARLLDRVPDLHLVAAHVGGWQIWNKVLSDLCGLKIWFDTSFISEIPPNTRDKIFEKHPMTHFVFASDSPWTDQKQSLADLRSIGLNEEQLRSILAENAGSLLGL